MASALTYPVRTPSWSLVYAGQNITADITKMVIDITYNVGASRGMQHDEHQADEIEVTLEDRDRRWQGSWFPVRGDIVTLQIGYIGEQFLDCGDYQVDELELKGPPDTFHLKCIGTGITPSIRTPRSAAYETQTLLQVAQTVAQRHNLTVVGLAGNNNVSFARVTQRNETDLHFLQRLAAAHNYSFSIRGNQLIFYDRTQLEQRPTVLTVLRTQTKNFEFKTRTQQIYKSASVAYQNPATKQLITGTTTDSTAPTGDDLHVVTRCETPQQAQLKADSALHEANRFEVTGRLETEGTVLLVAGVNIAIQGFYTFDGNYHIEGARHHLERSGGYETEIEVRQVG